MNNKKFLFIIYGLTGGGAERVVSVLCSHLAERGYDVHLGLYHRSEKDYPLSDKVCVHMLSEKRSENKLDNMRYRIKQISALIDEVKPDFTIPFLGTVVTETYFASRRKKTTFISTVRNDPFSMQMDKLNKMLIMRAYNHSDAVFVQNETQRGFFSKKAQKKSFVVFNPVSDSFLQNEHKNEGDILRIATSGRLIQQKNQKMLIEAIGLVAKKHSEVHLTIYGQGGLREQLGAHIKACGLENNVMLFGRSNDILSELQKNDMFVLSSNFEGMPNALLEAMALGMPCVSTDCRTGPTDMIVSYENGILTPVGDTEKMAEAILFMIENPEKAHEMGKKARAFAKENCATEVVIDKFIKECERFERK